MIAAPKEPVQLARKDGGLQLRSRLFRKALPYSVTVLVDRTAAPSLLRDDRSFFGMNRTGTPHSRGTRAEDKTPSIPAPKLSVPMSY